MSRKTYCCRSCTAEFLLEEKPLYCPYCGGEEIHRKDQRSVNHANEIIEEMNEIIPIMSSAWDGYVELYVEYENRRRLLMSYVSRGVIEKSDIPIFEQKKLTEALMKYRKRRKKNHEEEYDKDGSQ